MADEIATTSTGAEEPERLGLSSLDIAEERWQELLRLLPEVRTEGGKLDLEVLKLLQKSYLAPTKANAVQMFKTKGVTSFKTV
jgi:hypothetical protein